MLVFVYFEVSKGCSRYVSAVGSEEAVNKEEVIREEENKEEINKKGVNTRAINKEAVDKELVNKVSIESINRLKQCCCLDITKSVSSSCVS